MLSARSRYAAPWRSQGLRGSRCLAPLQIVLGSGPQNSGWGPETQGWGPVGLLQRGGGEPPGEEVPAHGFEPRFRDSKSLVLPLDDAGRRPVSFCRLGAASQQRSDIGGLARRVFGSCVRDRRRI